MAEYVCPICDCIHPLHRRNCANHPDARWLRLERRIDSLEIALDGLSKNQHADHDELVEVARALVRLSRA